MGSGGRLVIAVLGSFFALAGSAQAATYFVSASGSDTNPGTASANAWRSVSRVNSASLAPGDSVLFEGGKTFSDATLMPRSSGTSSQPITFGSYGSGRAAISRSTGAVWLPDGSHDLVFDNLDLGAAGAQQNVFGSSASGPGASNITVRNCLVHNSAGIGIVAALPSDHDWLIQNNEVTGTGDSGLLVFGSSLRIIGNRIHDLGGNSSISWAKHGIYAKGPDLTIANNDISGIPNGQAVSLRFHGARVYGNTIHDTPYAIGFFDFDTASAPQGTSYVYSNRLWNITGYGFYYDGSVAPNGQRPTVNFVLASNTFVFAGAPDAVNVAPSDSAQVQLANNVFSGAYDSALRAASTTSEHNNLWFGARRNVPAGANDVFAAPALAGAPAFSPGGTSPVAERGAAAVGGLSYVAACDSQPLHYCGTAPDLGAVEAPAGTPPPPTPPPAPAFAITYPTAAATTGLSFTATVTAPSGTTNVKFLVDGKKKCTVATGPFTCAIKVKAGQHSLLVQGTDASGKAVSVTATFTAAAG